ncbi:hypothetical protein AB9P05_10180 [Roseivirga sp. BDSF3-8]|uniref:hypothetical protein n=1 Tax=Roseivirga sp. BDSF3-8 TaxID=3241598 RepID=UPI003531A0D8
MAVNKKNALLKGFVGKVGGYVLKELPNGTQYIAKLPEKKKGKIPKNQKAENDDFSNGVTYAKQARLCPEAIAYYTKKRKKKNISVFHAAVSDYRGKPQIVKVEVIPNDERVCLDVMAVDNVGITEIKAEYMGCDGKPHSLLPNVENRPNRFEIPKEAIASAVTITVKDRPGNVDSCVVEGW